MTRILRLEGVANFRDYGDYATAAGARIHPGRLYRSAAHAQATDADLAVIEGLGIFAEAALMLWLIVMGVNARRWNQQFISAKG